MIFGRDVRGPLDVLQEEWVSARSEEDTQDSIIKYVTQVRERMESAHEKENMEQAQEVQKTWYDKKAR